MFEDHHNTVLQQGPSVVSTKGETGKTGPPGPAGASGLTANMLAIEIIMTNPGSSPWVPSPTETCHVEQGTRWKASSGFAYTYDSTYAYFKLDNILTTVTDNIVGHVELVKWVNASGHSGLIPSLMIPIIAKVAHIEQGSGEVYIVLTDPNGTPYTWKMMFSTYKWEEIRLNILLLAENS